MQFLSLPIRSMCFWSYDPGEATYSGALPMISSIAWATVCTTGASRSVIDGRTEFSSVSS